MKCELCKKEIGKYSEEFNRLELSDSLSVDICQDCIDKFMKWQGNRMAKLFPTRALKKRFEKH